MASANERRGNYPAALVCARATIHQVLGYRYEDTLLPDSAWHCAARW